MTPVPPRLPGRIFLLSFPVKYGIITNTILSAALPRRLKDVTNQ